MDVGGASGSMVHRTCTAQKDRTIFIRSKTFYLKLHFRENCLSDIYVKKKSTFDQTDSEWTIDFYIVATSRRQAGVLQSAER